jgi:hypothetical protein
MIFLDHIPDDVVSRLPLRDTVFSDTAEFFVFITGDLAGFNLPLSNPALPRERFWLLPQRRPFKFSDILATLGCRRIFALQY